MKKIFWAVLFTGVFLTVTVAAMVKAQDTTSKPNSPPQAMVEMMKTMGDNAHATGSMDSMRAMMERMQGMDTAKMMEHCQQMMGRAPGAEPNDKR
jgi:hypothetical protein